MKKIIVTFMIFLFLGEIYSQNQRYPSFDIEQVSKNVYLGVFHRPDNGARIGSKITILKGNEGLLLVDASFAQIYQLTRIKLKKFSDQPVKYVINTHFHVDHTGANGFFKKDGAIIIAHENVKEILSKEQKGFGLSALNSKDTFPAVPKSDLPDKTFADSMRLEFNDEEIKITHFPNAHTNSDAVVFFKKANVYDVGDIIWPESFAFVDWYNKGSAKGILNTLNKILKESTKETKYISGHGPVMTYNDLKTYRQVLKSTIEIIEKQILKGKSLEQIQKEGLPEKWKKWSGNLSLESVWIEMVYKTSSKNNNE